MAIQTFDFPAVFPVAGGRPRLVSGVRAYGNPFTADLRAARVTRDFWSYSLSFRSSPENIGRVRAVLHRLDGPLHRIRVPIHFNRHRPYLTTWDDLTAWTDGTAWSNVVEGALALTVATAVGDETLSIGGFFPLTPEPLKPDSFLTLTSGATRRLFAVVACGPSNADGVAVAAIRPRIRDVFPISSALDANDPRPHWRLPDAQAWDSGAAAHEAETLSVTFIEDLRA